MSVHVPGMANTLVVPLASLLAARDYLRDQLVLAAKVAYPAFTPIVREASRPWSGPRSAGAASRVW